MESLSQTRVISEQSEFSRKVRAHSCRENSRIWAAKEEWENVCNGCYCSQEELIRITQKILKGIMIYIDGRAYEGLILNGYTHGVSNKNEFAYGKSYGNVIEFQSYAKSENV